MKRTIQAKTTYIRFVEFYKSLCKICNTVRVLIIRKLNSNIISFEIIAMY